jgi:DNA-binding MarR family transcriptional regulator
MGPVNNTTRAPAPPSPTSLEETGLEEEFVAGLIIKALHSRGSAAGSDLAEILALPLPVLDDVIERLQERRFLQVRETRGPTRGEYVFVLTGEGRKRAAEELELSRYVGPAPVPLEEFRRWVEIQTIEGTRVSMDELRGALDGVVLTDDMFEQLGPAVNSGRSAFLYGESGNGKTLLAKRLARVFGERYFVPYTVLVDGSVMIVYDPIHHGPADSGQGMAERTVLARAPRGVAHERSNGGPPHAVAGNGTAPHAAEETEAAGVAVQAVNRTADPTPDPAPAADPEPDTDVLTEILRPAPAHDRRFAAASRPVVVTGGELTMEQLDLQWDAAGRMYQAPPQLKAAGGVLIIDDLGRQRVEIHDLLNRWGVPLEHRQDHLTLRSGRKLVVPFDCFVIFSTNVQPHALADDAFLRRIHYKIEVPDPDRDEFARIFDACCQERGIESDRSALRFLYEEFYGKGGIEPRRCHPRDILDHIQDLAEFRGEPVRLAPDLLDRACRSYFLTTTGTDASDRVTDRRAES